VNPDWFIANGGFKIGFGMAPKIGQVMAALILDGVDLIPDDFRANASMRPKG
jgi:glycine/D-amino acid oxidase-like deaminating enzyme